MSEGESYIYIYMYILYRNNEEKGKEINVDLEKKYAQLLHHLLGQLQENERRCKKGDDLTLGSDVR